jgi:tetratricopeptide (TPR) repeat protein
MGRSAEAVTGYARAVNLRPDSLPDWCNYGAALHELRRYDEAIACFDRALSLKSDMAEIHCNRANSLARLERHEEALAAYDRALALKPGLLDALNNRGAVLKKLTRHDEALASLEQALRIRPDFVDAHINRGNVLQALDRRPEAILCYERALALKPDNAEAHNNLGNALQFLDRYAEAIERYEIAIKLKPDYAQAHCDLAVALHALGRDAEAIRHYDQAIALKGDYAEAKWNKSLLYLSRGRLAEGWPLYEYRWQTISELRYSQRRWDGEHVNGTLLIWGEQGLGDEILYASIVPELGTRADSIVLEVEPRLVTLFARSFPGVQVIAQRKELYTGPIDAQEPIGGLGKYLRPNWQAFPPRERGYLVADSARSARLRERLTADKSLVVGLSWKSKNPLFAKSKSAQLRDFEPLLRWTGCRYVDLQYGDTHADRNTLESEIGVRLDHLDDIDNMRDIDGLAALISACDVVVTVSNTTAHLAGALGKPTWVLVPHGNARLWYWFSRGETSPWYPRVQVRRQSSGQTWADLASSVATEVFSSVEIGRVQPL